MTRDTLSSPENEETLRQELAALYQDNEFLKCRNMGEIMSTSLKMVFKHPLRKKYQFADKNEG
jgi:hypothetical protein